MKESALWGSKECDDVGREFQEYNTTIRRVGGCAVKALSATESAIDLDSVMPTVQRGRSLVQGTRAHHQASLRESTEMDLRRFMLLHVSLLDTRREGSRLVCCSKLHIGTYLGLGESRR